MNFCNNLQKLRKKMNMSQEQLAEALGVTRQSVSKWGSGASYPEMDKLVALCKIFNCELDDLVNKNIDEVKDLSSSKKIIISFFKSIGDALTKTIKMIENFSFRELIKFICQICIIIIVIAICSIPFTILNSAISEIFYGYIGFNIINSFIHFILTLIYSTFAIVAFFYIYKVKFLDSIEIQNNDSKTIINEEDKKVFKKEKFVIKSNRIGILDFLMTLSIWFLKFIFIVFMFPTVCMLIFMIICFIILIILIFKGLFLLGPILITLSISVFSIIILEILFNFIVNKSTNFKKVFIVCISSIVVSSIGTGFSIWYLTNLEIIDNVSSQYKINTKEEIIPMNDNLLIHDNYYGNIEYIEDNNIDNSVRIVVDYYKPIYSIKIINENNSIYIHLLNPKIVKVKKYVDEFINDLKSNKIYNYDKLSEVKVKVYATRDNINKIKFNKENISNDYDNTINN